MAVVLRLEQRKMPKKTREIFEQAENELTEILIPSIVFAEIGYLSEKKKIDMDLQKVRDYLKKFKILMNIL